MKICQQCSLEYIDTLTAMFLCVLYSYSKEDIHFCKVFLKSSQSYISWILHLQTVIDSCYLVLVIRWWKVGSAQKYIYLFKAFQTVLGNRVNAEAATVITDLKVVEKSAMRCYSS